MFEVFLDQPYKDLDVGGRDVVDVGMSFGDSTLFFALKGAKQVYAYEPMPKNFELAKANLAINGFSNISIFNAGVSSRDGWVRIDPRSDTGIAGPLRDSNFGISIQIISLDRIVNDFQLEDAALKLDCEGAEFDIIRDSKKETLEAFSEIVLEYHQEPTPIVSVLTQLGFSVSRTGSTAE
jgi:FkbM family methyltransferase